MKRKLFNILSIVAMSFSLASCIETGESSEEIPEVSINDLTPGNFNLYAEYYEHGFKAEEIATLEKDIQLAQAITDLVGHMGDLTRAMSKAMSEAVGEFKESVGVGRDASLGDTMKGIVEKLGLGEKKND